MTSRPAPHLIRWFLRTFGFAGALAYQGRRQGSTQTADYGLVKEKST